MTHFSLSVCDTTISMKVSVGGNGDGGKNDAYIYIFDVISRSGLR